MSSFNIEMDKYLEKRSASKASSDSFIDKKKIKKRNYQKSYKNNSKNYIEKFKTIFTILFNADEVIDPSYVNNNDFSGDVVSYKKWTLKNLFSKKENNRNSNVSDDVKIEYDNESVPVEKVNEILKSSKKNDIVNASSESASISNDGYETIKTVDNTENFDNNKSYNEFRNDLRDIIQISYKIMKNVPEESIKEFRKSSDYSKYVSILDKYNLIRKKNK